MSKSCVIVIVSILTTSIGKPFRVTSTVSGVTNFMFLPLCYEQDFHGCLDKMLTILEKFKVQVSIRIWRNICTHFHSLIVQKQV